MVVRYSTDSSISAALVQIAAVCLNMASTIAKDTLGDLGAPLRGVSHVCAPLAVCVLVVWTVLPPIGEVGDACVEHSGGDVGGDGGVMEDTWLQSSICIHVCQCAEGVVLIPSCVPIDFFELCQLFGEVRHFLVGVAEALDLSLQGGVSFTIKGKVDHR